MDRLSRLVAIMLRLQGHRLLRAEDLAASFRVSVRTIYRDLRALEEAGLPLYAEAGKGYSLVDGYHLPPVMFTQEEAGAMFVGGEFIEQLADESLRKHARSALLKIRAVLPSERKEFIERLQQSTAIYLRRGSASAESYDNLTTIQQAIVYRTVISLAYQSGDDRVTERKVEPLGLVYYADNWHLIGHCRLRDDIRDFRADRIRRIEPLNETFAERRQFSLRNYVETFGHGDDPRQARVRFTPDGARFTTNRHYYGFVEETRVDNGVEMLFYVPSLQWITGWILSFGAQAEAIAPQELRDLLTLMAEDTAQRYRRPAPALDATEPQSDCRS